MRRILIAAYHPLVIKGISQTVREQHPASDVIGEASSVKEFLTLLEKHKPDAAVVDVSVTWKCGVDLMEEVKRIHPATELHFVGVHPLDQHVVKYLERVSGCAAYQSLNGDHSPLL